MVNFKRNSFPRIWAKFHNILIIFELTKKCSNCLRSYIFSPQKFSKQINFRKFRSVHKFDYISLEIENQHTYFITYRRKLCRKQFHFRIFHRVLPRAALAACCSQYAPIGDIHKMAVRQVLQLKFFILLFFYSFQATTNEERKKMEKKEKTMNIFFIIFVGSFIF